MVVAGGEAGHRESVDVAARPPQPVHRLGGDDQGVGGVEAARRPRSRPWAGRWRAAAARGPRPGCGRPRSSPAPAAPGRRARTGTGPPCAAARGRRSGGSSSKLHDPELADPSVVSAPVVVEGALAQPLLADPVEVDVDDGAARTVGEALRLRQQVAALVDHRLAVPGQVGRGLALAGRGIDVRRVAARAGRRTSSRRSSARATVIGLPERLASTVAPASAASALGGTGTHMSSQTSTCSRSPGTSAASKIRSGPNGTSSPADATQCVAPVVAGGEVPALVELSVGRQVGLRRDAQHPPRWMTTAQLSTRLPCTRGAPTTSTGSRSAASATSSRAPPRPPRAGCPAAAGRRWHSRTAPARGRRPRDAASSWQARTSASTVARLPAGRRPRRGPCTRRPGRNLGHRPSRSPRRDPPTAPGRPRPEGLSGAGTRAQQPRRGSAPIGRIRRAHTTRTGDNAPKPRPEPGQEKGVPMRLRKGKVAPKPFDTGNVDDDARLESLADQADLSQPRHWSHFLVLPRRGPSTPGGRDHRPGLGHPGPAVSRGRRVDAPGSPGRRPDLPHRGHRRPRGPHAGRRRPRRPLQQLDRLALADNVTTATGDVPHRCG